MRCEVARRPFSQLSADSEKRRSELMLGAILGDIVCSFYEFAHSKKRDIDPLFHPKADFTDDKAMKIAVAEPLLDGADPAPALRACAQVFVPRLR